MGHKFHGGFTAAEKTELWDRWKRGESLKAIGRAFGKQSSSIYFLVAPHGGIRPAERRRATRQVAWPLSLDGEPGNEPQWRLWSLPSGACGRECLGASSSSKTL